MVQSMARLCCFHATQVKTLENENACLKTLLKDQSAQSSLKRKPNPIDGEELPQNDSLISALNQI